MEIYIFFSSFSHWVPWFGFLSLVIHVFVKKIYNHIHKKGKKELQCTLNIEKRNLIEPRI